MCVAWVHSTTVTYSWFASMLGLQSHIFGSGRPGRFLAMRYGSGGLVEARNNAITKFLTEQDEDWLFWIDTDMGFDPSIVDDLLADADPDTHPIVGALAFVSKETGSDGRGGYRTFTSPTIYRWAQQPDGRTGFVAFHRYPKNQLVECDATGAACVLIHRSVFEKIGSGWHDRILNESTGDLMGEDFSFFVRCAEHHVPVHVNTAVKTTHMKPVWLDEMHGDIDLMLAEASGSQIVDPV